MFNEYLGQRDEAVMNVRPGSIIIFLAISFKTRARRGNNSLYVADPRIFFFFVFQFKRAVLMQILHFFFLNIIQLYEEFRER